jgi:AcrR family transcriptional regulator
MPEARPADGRRARGMRSRAAILDLSVQLASREGLEGLTIGELAGKLDVSKSSVFALFGSKEELQLATLAAARGILVDQVVRPAAPAAEGIERLRALGEAWCDYLTSEVFAGGCFLCAASAEMDGRPGPVRDAVAAVMGEWLAILTVNIDAAVSAGELDAGMDSAAMAFRLNALGMAANWQYQLFADEGGVAHARTAWRAEIAKARP